MPTGGVITLPRNKVIQVTLPAMNAFNPAATVAGSPVRLCNLIDGASRSITNPSIPSICMA